jgi:hypothetical protein
MSIPATTYRLGSVLFVPLNADTPSLFGFSELLAGLALMVLAWTIADVKYRFRVRTAPLPLHGMTFGVVAALGLLTLLTDLWRAEGWLVPEGNILTPAAWQAILAGAFLLTFLGWAWFAFVRPPTYGRLNAQRYASALYWTILKGSPSELPVIASELAYSMRSLIRYATERDDTPARFRPPEDQAADKRPPMVTAYANDILLLIADKRFCRTIVSSSPVTALAVFQELAETKKYRLQIGTFARNIVNEALENRDSFLFHEGEGYESGLIGYHKPLSQAMFSNHAMVEAIGTLFDPDIWGMRKWDSVQWKAYCRVVLMTFRDYVDKGPWEHSFVLNRAEGNIGRSVGDLYKINGVANAWESDVHERLRVAVEFIGDAVKLLDKSGRPEHLQLRVRGRHHRNENCIHDHMANMVFEVIFAASAVRAPEELCWWVQHNAVWSELFNFNRLDGPAGEIIKFKVRRLIYGEIADLKRFPNYKGAKLLAFCLNVMGLKVSGETYDRDSRALQKTVLTWTKRNYAWLHSYNPRVAEACLVDGMSYDEKNLRLVKTYRDGLSRKPEHVYLALEPSALADADSAVAASGDTA